jgi:hypothetical protein
MSADAIGLGSIGLLSLPGGAPGAHRQRAASGPTELFAYEAAALDREGPIGRSVRLPLVSGAATDPVARGSGSIRGRSGLRSLSGTALRNDPAREHGCPTAPFTCEAAALDREGPFGRSVRPPLLSGAATDPVARGFGSIGGRSRRLSSSGTALGGRTGLYTGNAAAPDREGQVARSVRRRLLSSAPIRPVASGSGATEGSLERLSGSSGALRAYRRHGCDSPAKHFASVLGARDPASIRIRRPEACRRRGTLLPFATASHAEPRGRAPRPDRAVPGVGQPMPMAGFG